MATYTVSAFSVDTRRPLLLMPPGPFGIATGTITINPYSQTGLEITQITKLFKPGGFIKVYVDSLDAGFKYLLTWDTTAKCINAYVPATTAFAEAAEGATDIGAIEWLAIGQLG